MSDLFCFGLGFSALALARRLKAQGWTIAGTVRGEGAIAAAAAQGIEALAFDGAAPSAAVSRRLAQATHLLISVPPGAGGDPVLACHRADIIAGKLAGADDYVVKPVDIELLVASVEAQLRLAARMRSAIVATPDLNAGGGRINAYHALLDRL